MKKERAELDMNETYEEIKDMTKAVFKKLVKKMPNSRKLVI